MTKYERRKKGALAKIKRELRKIKSSPNSGTRRGYRLISKALLAKKTWRRKKI